MLKFCLNVQKTVVIHVCLKFSCDGCGLYPGHIVSSYGERKSSFMRWLSKLFKGGGASGRRAATDGQRPRSFGDGNTILRAPSKSSVLISHLYKHVFTFDDCLNT